MGTNGGPTVAPANQRRVVPINWDTQPKFYPNPIITGTTANQRRVVPIDWVLHQSKRFDPNPLVTGTPTNQRSCPNKLGHPPINDVLFQ
jgi:hypothetical protein